MTHDLLGIESREAIEVEPHQLGVRPAALEFRARRGEQKRRLPTLAAQQAEQLQRRQVGPVQVFKQEQRRLVVDRLTEDSDHGL